MRRASMFEPEARAPIPSLPRRTPASFVVAITGALALLMLQSVARADGVPWFVPFALLVFAAVAAWRPAEALVLLAFLVPLAAWTGRRWDATIAWPQTLVLAFASGYLLRTGFRREPVDSLRAPVQLLALIVVASIVVQLGALHWRIGGDALWTYLREVAALEFFRLRDNRDPIAVGARLLLSLVLLRAALTLAFRTSSLPAHFARAMAASAALAAALTLWRIWQGAQRLPDPVMTFFQYIATIRFNTHYSDLNAAGSYFILALLVSGGVLLSTRSRPWALVTTLIGVGLWVTGSRAAIVAGVLAAGLPLALYLRKRRAPVSIGTALISACLLVIVVAVGAAGLLPLRGNQRSSITALQVRWELAKTSVRMLMVNPAFGVGLGQYYVRSGEFSSAELLQVFPPARNENAHNNLLQILAELGLVGFAAFLWLLWGLGRRCASLVRSAPHDTLRWGMVAGLAAFVVTWLGGHPLLTDEPAFTFWMTAGVIGGWAANQTGRRPGSPAAPRKWASVIVAFAFLALVPYRIQREISHLEMEHVGIGLSLWQRPGDGTLFRTAGVSSSLFVPAHARSIVVPLRAIGPDDFLEVELRLDGRLADVVRVPRERWYDLHMILPAAAKARFRRLDVRVRTDMSQDVPMLMIGRVQPR